MSLITSLINNYHLTCQSISIIYFHCTHRVWRGLITTENLSLLAQKLDWVCGWQNRRLRWNQNSIKINQSLIGRPLNANISASVARAWLLHRLVASIKLKWTMIMIKWKKKVYWYLCFFQICDEQLQFMHRSKWTNNYYLILVDNGSI